MEIKKEKQYTPPVQITIILVYLGCIICLGVLNSHCVISVFQYSLRWHCWLHSTGQWLFSQRAGHYAQWIVWQVWPDCQGESAFYNFLYVDNYKHWSLSLSIVLVIILLVEKFYIYISSKPQTGWKILAWQLYKETLFSYQTMTKALNLSRTRPQLYWVAPMWRHVYTHIPCISVLVFPLFFHVPCRKTNVWESRSLEIATTVCRGCRSLYLNMPRTALKWAWTCVKPSSEFVSTFTLNPVETLCFLM